MTWRPINPNHAIERVRFVVQYKQDLSEKIINQIVSLVDKLKAETRLEGPTALTGVKVDFRVLANGEQQILPTQSAGNGWSFVRFSATRNPIEAFNVQGNQLVYETTEYRRWSTFKQRFSKVVLPSVNVTSQALDMDVASLEYHDRFYFDGPIEKANPTALVARVAPLLEAEVIDNGKLWHLHRGWFERFEGGDVLVNQNLDAIDVILSGGDAPSRSVGMLTRAEFRSANYPVNSLETETLLDQLHTITKIKFITLVNKEILPAIGAE